MRAVAWFFDHLPFLACFAVGVVDGVHGRTELALLMFVLGGLTEVAAGVSDLKRDVGKLAQRLSVLPDPPRIPERQGKAVSEAHAANTGHVSERESQ